MVCRVIELSMWKEDFITFFYLTGRYFERFVCRAGDPDVLLSPLPAKKSNKRSIMPCVEL